MTVTKPSIIHIGNVYHLHWEKEAIEIRVSRLIEDSRSTSGEFTVSTNGGGHLYHARVNLLSSMAKRSLAKELSGRVDLDWDTMVEQACIETLERFRSGEPLTTVGNMPETRHLEYQLYPFCIKGEITTIYGFGGSGKSYIASLIATCIQCGAKRLDWNVKRGNVLILDWETRAETTDYRIKAIKAGMNITSPEFPFYKRCHRKLADDISEIQSIVLDKSINMIIIDSVGMASGLDKDFHNSAIEFLRALRSLGVTALCIDHKPKTADLMFGSIYKYNEVRSVFEIKSAQKEGDNEINIAIFHRKVNDAPLLKPRSYKITFEGNEYQTDEVLFNTTSIKDVPDLMGEFSLRTRVKAILLGGSKELEEIAEELGEKVDSIKTTLYRNKRDFIKLTDGAWGLLSDED